MIDNKSIMLPELFDYLPNICNRLLIVWYRLSDHPIATAFSHQIYNLVVIGTSG
jgi:hypothetical protein